MCLGVPGRVVEVVSNVLGIPTGKVDFAGVVKEVCFAYTPDVAIGEYVVVHVGFAISKIDEDEARHVFQFLQEMGDLEDVVEIERPAAGARTED